MTLNDIQNSIRELGRTDPRRCRRAVHCSGQPQHPHRGSDAAARRAAGHEPALASLQAAYNAQYGHEASALSTGPAPAPAPAPPAGTAAQRHTQIQGVCRAFARAHTHRCAPAARHGGRIPEDPLRRPDHQRRRSCRERTADSWFRRMWIPPSGSAARELNPLADLFTVEAVSSNTGWRVIDTAPTAGMSALSSEAAQRRHPPG